MSAAEKEVESPVNPPGPSPETLEVKANEAVAKGTSENAAELVKGDITAASEDEYLAPLVDTQNAAHESAAGLPKKKKKSIKKKRRTWTGRQIDRVKGAWAGSREILGQLLSSHSETRHMAWLFLFSLCGLVLTAVLGLRHFQSNYNAAEGLKVGQKAVVRSLSEFVTVEKEVKEHVSVNLELGRFVVKVEAEEGQLRLPHILNVAELKIVVSCDEKATCAYIDSNPVRARDLITQELDVVQRSDLMTSVGKKRLQLQLGKRINQWLPQGHVTEVYFTDLVIN